MQGKVEICGVNTSRLPVLKNEEAQALLEVSQSTAGRILKEMVDKGQIATLGTGRALRYELV